MPLIRRHFLPFVAAAALVVSACGNQDKPRAGGPSEETAARQDVWSDERIHGGYLWMVKSGLVTMR